MSYSQPMQGQDPYGPQQEQFQLTPEEIEVLKVCSREGVFSRAIPLGIVFGLGGLFGAKAGPLMHAKFGVKPAVLGLGIIGYFMGRISYSKVCFQRALEVPGGSLKKVYDMRRGVSGAGEYVEQPRVSPQYYATVEPSKTQEQTWTDQRPMANFDVPAMSNLDAYSSDYEHKEDRKEEPISRNYTSYDDLRKQNRDEYSNRIYSHPQQRNPGYPQEAPAVRRRPQYPQDSQPLEHSGGQKTKYGDTWDV